MKPRQTIEEGTPGFNRSVNLRMDLLDVVVPKMLHPTSGSVGAMGDALMDAVTAALLTDEAMDAAEWAVAEELGEVVVTTQVEHVAQATIRAVMGALTKAGR